MHVVDLNGAMEGRAVNAGPWRPYCDAVSIPVQLGGGIRRLEDIEALDRGRGLRVILGTVAVTQPEIVLEAARLWPEQIAVSVDVRGGKVATHGWTENLSMSAIDLARRFEDAGVGALIITDIDRDGALTGVNVEGVGELADAVSIPVIASGGVAAVADIERLKARPGVKIAGAILGRSLYAGTIQPAEALTVAAA
jgi:phosphoribosylformimino-5-aminoimidazole carboxamide ribotide isomerase